VHNTNDQSFVRVNDTSDSTNIDVSATVVIDAFNVNGAVGFEFNADVVSGYSTVRASIYERRRYTVVVFFMIRHLVFYTCRVDGTCRIFGHNPTNISWWKLVRTTPLCCIY
jgi:hypothetical protein